MNPQKSFRLPCDGKTANREPKIKYPPRKPAKFAVGQSRPCEIIFFLLTFSSIKEKVSGGGDV